jgi:hypothetical protein
MLTMMVRTIIIESFNKVELILFLMNIAHRNSHTDIIEELFATAKIFLSHFLFNYL